MKAFIALITICLVTVMVFSSPIARDRYPAPSPARVKAGWPAVAVKGSPTQALEYPRKGEYFCGNKICKLTPGVVPPGCNGVCQYPL